MTYSDLSPAGLAGGHAPDDDNCYTALNHVVAGEPGIVNLHLDPENELVAFEYDPSMVSDPDIVRIAGRVAPEFQHRLDTCVMRLERQGGRACETCALNLERQVSRLEGVRRATASYIGGVLTVSYDNALISPEEIARRAAGMGARLARPGTPVPGRVGAPPAPATPLSRFRRWLTPERLQAALAAITFVSMMGGLLAEKLDGPSPLIAALYAVTYVSGGAFALKAGVESLRLFTIDVDLLMVLAAVGAAVVGAPFEGAMLLFLFSLSNVLQVYALDRTRNAIRALMKLRPEQALARRGSRTVVLPIEQIVVGDRVIVRPGERVPLDGLVLEGESTVDQSSITGESMPVNRGAGDAVLAGTINQNGALEVRVTKLAKDSVIAKMIKLVEEAQSEKAKTQRFIDRFEQYYALAVIAFTAVMIVAPPLIFRQAFGPSFYRAMTIMVAASPCALVVSTPASILSAIGNGARRGVLFKGGAHVEQAAAIKVVAFDKTGTLTQGKPQVTDVRATAETAEDDLLALAAAVEARSEHPLAQAIVAAARERGIKLAEAAAFQARPGRGVQATLQDKLICVGSLRYFEGFRNGGLEPVAREVERLQNQGKTAIVAARMSEDGSTAHLLGVIGIADVLRPDAAAVVQELKSLGVQRVVMLTGDNARVAKTIAAQAGVDEFYAELMPEDKLQIIKDLKTNFGVTAMVGDGVNDAPALATASLGIAMGAAGSDVALETADVVLLADNLSNLPYAIALSRQTRKTLIVNLGFSLFMILLMLVSIFAVSLPLPLAVVGHEGGTVIVSLNGLRLLGYRRRRGNGERGMTEGAE